MTRRGFRILVTGTAEFALTLPLVATLRLAGLGWGAALLLTVAIATGVSITRAASQWAERDRADEVLAASLKVGAVEICDGDGQ